MDFAGGLVIHASAGISGFIFARVIQPRKNYKHLPETAHNMPLASSSKLKFSNIIFYFSDWCNACLGWVVQF